MRGDVSKPVDAGGFERGVGIEAAGHGLVNDGLLLFVQHLNQPTPIADEPADLRRVGVKVVSDGLLLIKRNDREGHTAEVREGQVLPIADELRGRP